MSTPLLLALALFLALPWFVGPGAALAAQDRPPLTLQEGHGPHNLALAMEILPDPEGKWTVEQAASPELAPRFMPMHSPNLRIIDLKNAAYWLRFRLALSSAEWGGRQPWLLELGAAYLGSTVLYAPVAGGNGGWLPIVQPQHSSDGQAQPVFRNTVLPLPPEFDSSRYFYLRLQTSLPVNTTALIYEQNQLVRRSQYGFIGLGIFYGIMLAMIILNLSMFFSLHDRVYLYYVFYTTAMLLYNITIFGQTRLVMDLSPNTISSLLLCLVAAIYFFAAQLTRSYLRTAIHAPRWDKALLAIMGFSILHFLSAIAGSFTTSVVLGYVLGTFGPMIGLTAWFICLHRGFKASGFFLAAWTIFFVGAVIWDLLWMGIAPAYVWTDYSFALGTSLEAVLLSFAMGQRIHNLRTEKEALATSERRYHQMSLTDDMTGLYNKRFLRSRLTSEVEHAARMEQPLALAMLDVDHFKRFNDTHGHPAGDSALIGLARVMEHGTRPGDFCCRFGGEEFVIILPGAGLSVAQAVAERIRQGFMAAPFQQEIDQERPITVSVGLALLSPPEPSKSLLVRADRALYRAKHNGRNRVELAA